VATEVISREAQRQFPRFVIPASKPVRVDLGPAGSGHVLDISEGGLRVKSVAPLRRDSELPLYIYIGIPETGDSLKCAGLVVWSKPNGAAGLKFKDLADEQRAVLLSWLDELRSTSATPEKATPPDEFTRITSQIKSMKLNNADALNLIVRRTMQLAIASGVAVALGKPENMICLGCGGKAPEVGSVIPPNVGLTGECVRGRKPALCDDASTDPRAVDLKQGSAVILPLLVNGEVRGVMQVFSAQPHAFDARCLENMEKLADAVVFVAHGITPQRRMASVMSMPKTSAAASSTNPAQPSPYLESKVTPITARPASGPQISRLSETGRFGAFTGPVVKLPVISTPKPAENNAPPISLEVQNVSATELDEMSIEPVALEPIAASVETAPVAAPRRVAPIARPQPATPLPITTYHVNAPKRPGWLITVPAVAILVTVAGALYWSHHRSHAVTPPTAATVSPIPSPAETHLTEEAPSPTPPVASAPAPAPPVNVPAPKLQASTPALVTKAAEKKAPPPREIKEPEPAPMVIASGAPVPRPAIVDDSEFSAPSATGIASGSAMPGIATPSSASTPKLVGARSASLTGGTLLERVPPIYPQSAKINHVEGKVEVLAVITTSGTVDRVRKVSGNQYLVQATIDAVKRWRYEPYKLDGQLVEREITIEVNFTAPK